MNAPNPLAHHLYFVQAIFGEGDSHSWQEWYDTQHVLDLLSVPGFLAADRYQHVSRAEQFIAVYEISDPDVFSQERYREITGWGRWAHSVKEWQRGIYRRLDDPSQWSRTD